MTTKEVIKALPGPRNLHLRRLYRILEQHYTDANCPLCTCYKQYGTMIVKGSFLQHIDDVVNSQTIKKSIIDIDIEKLNLISELVETQEITPCMYRLTFVLLQPKEILVSGTPCLNGRVSRGRV